MPRDDLKRKLQQLHQDLGGGTDVDPELKKLLETVDADIHAALDRDTGPEHRADLMERIERMETRFAAEHPHLEPVLREIVHLLGRIGI